jgi:hypothetical protein
VCPDCGISRDVSLEQACRIKKGVHSARCATCKRPPVIKVTEEHRRYWLELSGVPATAFTRKRGARAYVRENGLPERLTSIAASAAFLPR